MSAYEKIKHDVIAKISARMPEMPLDTLRLIAQSLDEAVDGYTITEAETHLSIVGRDEFIRVIKNYFVIKKMEGLSEKTLSRYLLALKSFVNKTMKPIGEVTANDTRLFLFAYQNEREISNRSLEGMRGVICTFFRWAAAEGYIDKDPTVQIKPIRWTAKPREALEQIDLELIRKACSDARELALVEVFYSTGCRVSELIGIKLNDIDWDKRTVLLFGKGGKYRTSYINAKAEIAIKEYLKTRKHNSEYLFCNIRGGKKLGKDNIERIVRNLKDRAGLGDRRVTPHVFRHTTATHAVRSGMPVTDIQQLLGHSNVATTMVYAHISNESVQAGHRRCIV